MDNTLSYILKLSEFKCAEFETSYSGRFLSYSLESLFLFLEDRRYQLDILDYLGKVLTKHYLDYVGMST